MPKNSCSKHYLPHCLIRLVRDGSIPSDRASIRAPEDAYEILKSHFCDLSSEMVVAVLLNTKNRVLAVSTVSVGSLSASIVHPREVFQRAILANAASVILAHNHPSGDPAPSPEDIELTRRLVDAGRLLDIALLDHVVVGDGCFCSLKERGFL